MRRIQLLSLFNSLFLLLFLVSAGCREDSPDNCSIDGQKQSVYNILDDNYLWYDSLPAIGDFDFDKYETPEDVLEALRNENDRWSYIVTIKEYEDHYAGKYYGYGFGYKMIYEEIDGKKNLKEMVISIVYPETPAAKGKMKRGQKILEINHKTVQEIEANNEWSTIYGKEEKGVLVHFKLENNDSTVIDTEIPKDDLVIKSVYQDNIVEFEGKKVGYIAFKSFINPSSDELSQVFKKFKESSVNELVVDMRYNGGGLLSVATYLASLIAGNVANKEIFYTLTHNNKHTGSNESAYFSKQENNLPIERVFFITTKSTASASEAVINGIKPFMKTIVVGGEKTYGKPVGMYNYEFCDKAMAPISFKIANSEGYGDYFTGLDADCVSDDDIYHELATQEESSFKEVLYYIKNGKCSPKSRIEKRNLIEIPFQDDKSLKGMSRIFGHI